MKFQYCPMCARDLVPPETVQEDPEHPEFEPVLRRCSGCGGPWPTCECRHAAEGEQREPPLAESAPQVKLRNECANAISDVAGKARRGELGAVDAALVVTVESSTAPPRIGMATARLDQKGALWVLENLVNMVRAREQQSRGGIILPH